MKKYIIGFILVAISAGGALWWFKFKKEPTLADLQKQYVLAKTEVEKNKIVDRLEQYYLNLSVPDSLRQRVDREVATQLDTTKINSAVVASDTNVYRLERQLQNLLQTAAIARARDENEIFKTLIDQAKNLAHTVDTGTQNHYWATFVEIVSSFKPEQALMWLKAKRAERLVWFYLNSAGKSTEAERAASLGLNLLQHVKDDRLWLDIVQRLQHLLYWDHSMYDLSLALAQKALPLADKIKYHSRSTGLILAKAEVFLLNGQNQAALACYDSVFQNAQKFKQINGMQWFANQSIVKKAEMHRELGDYEKAAQACREAERMNLDPKATTQLHIAKFNLLLETAHYEQAETEIREALALAESQGELDNRIECLVNLGALYYQLTEFDLALAYFKQAQALFTASIPSLSTRMAVFGNIARIFAAKHDSVEFEKTIREAQGYMRLASSPYRQAQLLSRIGDLYHLASKNYSAAIEYHRKADSIAYQNGFLRFSLAKRIDLLDCLVALLRFSEAKALIAEIEPLAKALNDSDGLINIYDRVAQIHYREGNIAQAVESSNRLRHEIEAMSARFNNPDRLIAFRQKIYDGLKYAVLYEIALQHQEIAFAKLDQAKAYTLKNRLFSSQANNQDDEVKTDHLNLDFIKTKLHTKSLLIDYMITPDTLYVFVLGQEGLQLLRKKMNIEALRQTTNAHRDSINKTPRLFQHYDAQQAQAHYASTVALGQKLYHDLLGWPEIEARLSQTDLLYIVPDEFLYEIPFTTLMANRSDAKTFLVNRSAVLTLPSASLLANLPLANGTLNTRQTKNVLISADKRFPGAEQFVAEVKALFPLAEELTVPDGTFTKDAILAQLQKDHQIFIFLGHGQANAQYPEWGYIELSVRTPSASTARIIQLTMADLKTINWLGAEMVMLVGCETAGGKLYRGAGISGLQQEFLSLGAQNVLGNLWEVDATYAISQAQHFLTSWATAGNPAQALQASQRQAVQALQGHRYYQQPHPYFWGSAVLLTVITQ